MARKDFAIWPVLILSETVSQVVWLTRDQVVGSGVYLHSKLQALAHLLYTRKHDLTLAWLAVGRNYPIAAKGLVDCVRLEPPVKVKARNLAL